MKKSAKEIYQSLCRSETNIAKNKWRRNGRYYFGSLFNDVTSVRDRTPIGLTYFDYSIEPDVGVTPYYNLIKSCIDTKTSRIASNKVRPGILPHGKVNFSTRKKARAFRKAIDRYFEDGDLHSKFARCFRDACIFETAYIWVDTFTMKCYNLFPWEVGTLGAETRFYNTKLLIKLDDFPRDLLRDYGIKDIPEQLYNRLEIWYDLTEQEVEIKLNGKPVRTEKWKAEMLPIVKIESTKAINGNRTVSIADELSSFQEMLNRVNAVINEAAGLAPGFYVVGPQSDDVDAQAISNGNGRYIGINPGQGGQIVFETPRFIDPEWFNVRDMIIASAHQAIGVSQMAAANKNPLGPNASGKALETMENAEDARFQIEMADYIKKQEEIAKIIIHTFDEKTELADGITIKEIKDDFANLKLEFVSLSWLSRDPQTRYGEIQNLLSMGLIPQNMALELMEFGGLTTAYTFGSAYQDAIDKMIEDAVENEIYEFPVRFMGIQDAITMILLEMNQYWSTGDREACERLNELLDVVKGTLVRPGIDMIQVDPEDKEALDELAGTPVTPQEEQNAAV